VAKDIERIKELLEGLQFQYGLCDEGNAVLVNFAVNPDEHSYRDPTRMALDVSKDFTHDVIRSGSGGRILEKWKRVTGCRGHAGPALRVVALGRHPSTLR